MVHSGAEELVGVVEDEEEDDVEVEVEEEVGEEAKIEVGVEAQVEAGVVEDEFVVFIVVLVVAQVVEGVEVAEVVEDTLMVDFHSGIKMTVHTLLFFSSSLYVDLVCIYLKASCPHVRRIFKLFFSEDVIASLVTFTNEYAWMHIAQHPSFAQTDGSWKECTNAKMQSFIATLIYFGLVRVPDVNKYWSGESLYNGLWARSMLS